MVHGYKVSPLVLSIFIGQNADLTSGLDCIENHFGNLHCIAVLSGDGFIFVNCSEQLILALQTMEDLLVIVNLEWLEFVYPFPVFDLRIIYEFMQMCEK